MKPGVGLFLLLPRCLSGWQHNASCAGARGMSGCWWPLAREWVRLGSPANMTSVDSENQDLSIAGMYLFPALIGALW